MAAKVRQICQLGAVAPDEGRHRDEPNLGAEEYQLDGRIGFPFGFDDGLHRRHKGHIEKQPPRATPERDRWLARTDVRIGRHARSGWLDQVRQEAEGAGNEPVHLMMQHEGHMGMAASPDAGGNQRTL